MNFYDAFISYGRADSKDFATKLHEKLQAEGLNIWFDQKDIPLAVDFQEQINDGIEKSHNFIFIISPHAINSLYCLQEIELAIKLNKRIIPLLHVEQISQETWQQRNPNQTEKDWQKYQQQGRNSIFPNMHPTICKINWVYFRENIDDFSTALTSLFTTINQHQDYIEQHTQFLVRALEWLRNQQQTNYLLVGEEKEKAEKWLKKIFRNEQPPCIPTDLHCEFICESIKNAQNLLSQVFISASEEDTAIKEKISKTLMRKSFTVWKNKTDIKTGSKLQEAIHQGIEGADNFVCLISVDSLKSEYCQQELSEALESNKRIIPLLISKTNLELIPLALKKLQFIDFSESENPEKYCLGADRLLQELNKESSYYEQHKILLVKARKWERQNYNPCLLLRGYNLQHFQSWLKVAKQQKDYPPLSLQDEFINASLNKTEAYSLQVFISYSRTDSDFARKLNDGLQELGKTTWFDQESIATGTDFQQEIYRGIEISDNFLFIISPKSINSPYCADEVEYAYKLNKRIVTILHRPLSAADKQKLPPALAALQWLDFNQHGGEFSTNFNELIRTLDTDREHIRNHSKWSQRALEWQEKDKSPDLLLRGNVFAVAEEWLKTAEKENKNPLPTDLQKELIDKSRQAIQAQKKQQKQQIFVLRSLLVIAIGASIFAFSQKQEAEEAEKLRKQELIRFTWISIKGFNQDKYKECGTRLNYGLRNFYCTIKPFVDYRKLMTISGLPIFNSGPHANSEINFQGGYKFGYYNQEFLKWIQEEVIIDINQNQFKEQVQLGYNNKIRIVARAFYQSHKILFANPEEFAAFQEKYKVVQKRYQQQLKTRQANELKFVQEPQNFQLIKSKYLQRIQNQSVPAAGLNGVGSMLNEDCRWLADYLAAENENSYDKIDERRNYWELAVVSGGFWVRRSIDGTEKQFFDILTKILRMYDGEWLNQQEQTPI